MICLTWSLTCFLSALIDKSSHSSLCFIVIKRTNKWTMHAKIGHFKAFFDVVVSPWDLFSFSSANFDPIPGVTPAVSLVHSPGGACTCFGTQRCFPMVQPFWSRKALKSVVLMQQQLQYLYLNNNKKRKYKEMVTVFKKQAVSSWKQQQPYVIPMKWA